MRKSIMLCALAALVFAIPAASQTVDEVIAKNIQARGGLAKLRAVKSIRMTGRMTLGQGMEAPITLELKRPKQMRMEFTFQGMTGIQGYDGTTGWQVMPFGGKKDPEPMSADDLKDAEEQADLDGPFVDYKEKGNQVELLGKENVEGATCFKVKLTLKGGDVRYYYIDSDSYLDLKVEGKRKIRGNEVETETSLGDYKEVEGLMVPHAIDSGIKGTPQRQKLSVDKVEINSAIDDARFKMPEVKPAEPKPAETKPPAGYAK